MGIFSDVKDGLNTLLSQFAKQSGVGEDPLTNLHSEEDGKVIPYGKLGDFANKFDKTAERSYQEQGYFRDNINGLSQKQLEILMQQPDITVFVKKRMFSSIAENYRPDFMNEDEAIYYKACKILFANKATAIGAYEKLTKLSNFLTEETEATDALMSIIIGLADTMSSNSNSLLGQSEKMGQLVSIVDKLRAVSSFNQSAKQTRWVNNSSVLPQELGSGTGVIELCNVFNLSTNVTNSIERQGSCRFTLDDPYNLMLITDYDIEKAISEATNYFTNQKIYQFSKTSSEQLIKHNIEVFNSLRDARGASRITVRINPDSIISKKVIAIVDNTGQEIPFTYSLSGIGITSDVNISDEYLQGGEVLGFNGLSEKRNNSKEFVATSELIIFKDLIRNIYNQLTLNSTTENSIQLHNKNTNYARRKMRFQFSGRNIIQPQDVVHVYINSKAKYDSQVLGGVKNTFTGLSLIQNINKTSVDLKNAFDTLFNPGGNTDFQIEKEVYVGKDFPNHIWSLVRNTFLNEKEGTHVFGGIVLDADGDLTNNRTTLNVNCNDKSAYLEMGKINFKPGVDTFNGAFFDPLTPFESNFDIVGNNFNNQIPQLLKENRYLLSNVGDKNSSFIKNKQGALLGKPLLQDNYIQDISVAPNGRISRTFYAPDGLVYKWKEGISTYVQEGNSLDLNDPARVGIQSITVDPFAGQDVMNCISLSITGHPYNFATYFNAVKEFNFVGNDEASNKSSAYVYSDNLRKELIKRNVLWGNFIPFKNLVLDEESYKNYMTTVANVQKTNDDIANKLKKLKDIQYTLITKGSYQVFNIPDSFSIADSAKNLEVEANLLKDDIEKSLRSLEANDNLNIQTVGDESLFNFDEFMGGESSKAISDNLIKKNIRKKLNLLTRRMSYDVRANQDKNLFIVDDTYDKNYDIIAFNKQLESISSLYNNFDNITTKQKILTAAQLLGLEVLCDTQGHLRARMPQYNRMPSSVFYKMMYLKDTLNIQVFPDFLNDLFKNQIDSYLSRLSIIEDYIRLDCSILGYNTDSECFYFISSKSKDNLTDVFTFISSEESGNIDNYENLLKASQPDYQEENEFNNPYNKISKQAISNKDIFTNSARYKVILQALTTKKLNDNGLSIMDTPTLENNTRADILISRIQTNSGVRINKSDYINKDGLSGLVQKVVDVFKVTEELSDKLRERQRIIKDLYYALKNVKEARSLDDSPNSTSSNLLFPGNYTNSKLPESLEHMIEDETYDDYGPGSGTRYVIKNAQIKGMNIKETKPDYNMVEVVGTLSNYNPNLLPEGLNSFPNKGNGLVTAFAVDYDSWRNYGLLNTSTVNIPFFNNASNQCAPYAAVLLSKARKNILRGTVSLVGNEYYQPGDVVYLEERQLLMYVEDVSHSFTYGSEFSTNLTLSYGHSPGDYIPQITDIIGKILMKNRDEGIVVVQRQSSSINETNVGAVIRDRENYAIFDDNKNNTSNTFNSENTKVINDILYTCSNILNLNNSVNNNQKAKVELRIYTTGNANSGLSFFAKQLQNKLKNGTSTPTQTFGAKGSFQAPTIESSVVEINLDDKEEIRSPSQKAMNSARQLIQRYGTSSGSPISVFDFDSTQKFENYQIGDSGYQVRDQLKTILTNYIVDCWISFEEDIDKNGSS